MLRRLFLCALLLCCVIGCNKKSREGVAVIVNGYEITSAQVAQAAELLRESMIAAYPEKAIEGVGSDLAAGAAQQLIANRLLIEEATSRGISADSAAVDSAYNIIIKRFPDRAAFERELTKMGESDSSFRSQVREGVRLDALMKTIFADVHQVDSQECIEFYEKNKNAYIGSARVRASQIFFPFIDSMTDDAKQKLHATATDVRRQIVSGKSFGDCAKKYSRGPGALEGGDIGWFKKGDLKPELENPIFLLKKGEMSDVIVTDVGLFLLQKTDEEAEKQLPFEEVKDRVKFLLEIKARNTLIGRHIDDLMAKAKIEYIDTSLAKKPSLGGLPSLPAMTQ